MKVKLNASINIAGLDVSGNEGDVIDVSHVPPEIVEAWLASGMVSQA